MRKRYQSGLLVSALAAGSLLIGAQAFAAHWNAGGTTLMDIELLDSAGNPIPVGSNVAYSAKETCGGCHNYEQIEAHSYHAQLGANEHKGWHPFDNGNWNSVAPKNKPWVQSPGHTGKW